MGRNITQIKKRKRQRLYRKRLKARLKAVKTQTASGGKKKRSEKTES